MIPVSELRPQSTSSAAFKPGRRVPSVASPDLHAIATLIHDISRDLVPGPALDTRAIKALQAVEERFRRLADAVPDVIWILDLNPERVVYASPSFERVWGLPAEELYRNPRLWLETIHAEDRERVRDRFERWIAGEPVDSLDVDFRIVHTDGSILWIHERGVLILDDRGKPRTVGSISTDMTELRKTEMELRRSEAYLAEAQRLSLTGSFGWRPDTGEILWSDETCRIFDVEPGTKPSVEFVLQRTHPDDRAQVGQALERASRGGVWDWDLVHRIMMPDGSMKHLHVVARVMRVEEGGGMEYVGAVMDVTAASQSRHALEAAYRDIQALKDRLHNENVVLREELDKSSMFEEIVGGSASLHQVLSCVSKVAPTESTVLITGETGTGKELVARAIHRRSKRSGRVFVTVNCSAIPPTLVGSELFGHERGAFTGALQRRLGRFELAEGGTIFLDEIGDLPAETQIALLRVLQERECERIGGGRPVPVDVRVIAATNIDLEAAIAKHEFRADLFYRLNVVPIAMPSLRDRRDDIPMLVDYFVERFSRKLGKRVRAVNRKSMDLLLSYAWPGNVRELQNVIERAITLADSDTLTIDARWLSPPLAAAGGLEERFAERRSAQERSMIEAALTDTRGRVSGRYGAATRLGMPASTLESKIRSLGIDKGLFHGA
jgi:PAS domain S-box-containing protein